MLELGKAGSAGTAKGVLPGAAATASVVATLRASNWKEAATAVVGDREWVLRQAQGASCTGRWAAEPEDAVRLRARQASFWKGTWAVDLEGTPVDVEKASIWKGTHRTSSAAGRSPRAARPAAGRRGRR